MPYVIGKRRMMKGIHARKQRSTNIADSIADQVVLGYVREIVIVR